jgi:phosphotransacetylase
MATEEIIQNRTFDEIRLGDTATASRTVSRDDLALIAGLIGTAGRTGAKTPPGIQPSLVPEGAQAMWCEALIAEVLHTKLPGPGVSLVAQSSHLDGPISVGGTITAEVKVRDRLKETRTIAFDWQCADQAGARIASGVAEVIAPAQKFEGALADAPQIRVRRHEKYEKLIERCRGLPPTVTAIAYPCSESALVAGLDAAKAGIIAPLFVGPVERMKAKAASAGLDLGGYEMVDVPDGPLAEEAAAEKAVELVRIGKAAVLMKGSLHTDTLMSAVVRRENGLRTDRRISQCFVLDVPTYHKPLIVTDAAINISPDLDTKADIVQNAIDLARMLGVEQPRVAILSAVESINSKIQSTLDAAALCKMADRRQITGGLLDGPLAMDNAISKEAAKIKGISSPVAGDADILVAPDLEAGNMIAKNLTFLAEADAAGIVLGARIPIILTSRADSVMARMASCAVAALCAHAKRAA